METSHLWQPGRESKWQLGRSKVALKLLQRLQIRSMQQVQWERQLQLEIQMKITMKSIGG